MLLVDPAPDLFEDQSCVLRCVLAVDADLELLSEGLAEDVLDVVARALVDVGTNLDGVNALFVLCTFNDGNDIGVGVDSHDYLCEDDLQGLVRDVIRRRDMCSNDNVAH